MKTKIQALVLAPAGLALLSISVISSPVHAQLLQPGSGGANGLQTQTGQTQQTTESLNQTGGLQNNNGQQALTQDGVRPLGVVSSPSQTTPEAVAAPSSTLKTDITQTGSSNQPWLIAGGVAALIAVIIFFAAKSTNSRSVATEKTNIESAPTIKPEPVKPRKKRSSTPKKKRKKTNQR